MARIIDFRRLLGVTLTVALATSLWFNVQHAISVEAARAAPRTFRDLLSGLVGKSYSSGVATGKIAEVNADYVVIVVIEWPDPSRVGERSAIPIAKIERIVFRKDGSLSTIVY